MALNSCEKQVETLVVLDEKRQYDTLNKSLFTENYGKILKTPKLWDL